ncbi:DNA cytosine methyltransferase [Psychrosphaera sp. 1_MG-2023]|uniref:DNA cytosine methyltransferase n=1 Tax=Psychrosphaera sp. 1_MG-2023 TaxID=3062643 RepID=UPI0026E2C58F|nr:DNA cytosine methyltransferase [Psychrosphaera sp. 1_MG-2023]MDO6717964.1 DNA cytosine methyltransferase [Psychrosphaera sp. 1_MG-2023]
MQHEIFLEKEHVLKWVKTKRTTLDNNNKSELRFVDLFSGCGGLSLGIVRAAELNGLRAKCAFALDSNLAPLNVFKDNIPHIDGAVEKNDILELFDSELSKELNSKELELKTKVGKVNVLVAGPPCQGHSDLNNSTRRYDPRNKLYLSCIRAVEVFEPDLIIIENVPTVIHSKEGVVQVTEKHLSEKGYTVKHININFLDLGLPQSRKRHLLVASKNQNFISCLATLKQREQKATLREYIEDSQASDELIYKSGKLSKENIARVQFLFDNNLYDLPNSQRPPCHRDKSHSYKSVYGRLNWDEPAQTITSGYGSMGQGRYIHPSEKRTINSREAARIQGFPDYYSFESTSKLTELRKMIANAVPPQLTFSICSHYFKEIA